MYIAETTLKTRQFSGNLTTRKLYMHYFQRMRVCLALDYSFRGMNRLTKTDLNFWIYDNSKSSKAAGH